MTQIICWNERCFFLRQTFTVRDEVRAVAMSQGIVRSQKGNLRPQDVFDSFGERLVSPPMPPEVEAWYSMRNQ